MSKQKSAFFCQNCGASSAKWVGKCPACGEWNTYVEEVIKKDNDRRSWSKEDPARKRPKPTRISEVTADSLDRIASEDTELDRVLGGGIVKGSLVLIGGEPGIGKSTLMLQVAIQLKDKKILYVSGEESLHQIRMRADRVGIRGADCFLLAETDIDEIFNQIAGLDPDILIIDSIQTVFHSGMDATPGSISQVRECAGQLMRYAKESNVPVFLIGHINKEGNIAGPKVLEHMVDTVLQFEGDRQHIYRILRTSKNRFGSTSELGIYQMRHDGLRIVENPSEILLTKGTRNAGVAVGATLEGNRPLLIEVQALVTPATYGTPQRSSTGFDVKRLHMLIAVLEKRMGVRLGVQDVFLNITGGIKVNDPSLDLPICAAIYSSYQDIAIGADTCLIGEVGLGGEIRPVTRIAGRIKEAIKLGFKELYVSGSEEHVETKAAINRVKALREVMSSLFG